MNNKRVILILLLILAVTVFFRFWRLTEIPPGLYPDVAMNGNDALQALKTGHFKVFYPANNGREGLFMNLIALSFWLFGVSIWTIKIVPAIIGTLTVLGLYFLTKELFKYGKQKLFGQPNTDIQGQNKTYQVSIALLASFFIAVSFWHVNFSRLGFRAIMTPFCLVWAFYFLFKGLSAARLDESLNNTQSNSLKHTYIINWLLAGLFFGLGFHTYISFRIAPIILLPVLFFEILQYLPYLKLKLPNTKKMLLGVLLRWSLFFVTIIIVVAPLTIYFLNNPQDFIGRTGQVSVFSDPHPFKALSTSAVKALGMFNVWGDCNWRHNYACRPILLWPVGIVFLIGFFWTAIEALKNSNWRQKQWPSLTMRWTLLAWFFAMLLPTILTNEGTPHALRSIGAIPPVFIFAGLGAFLILKVVKIFFQKNGVPLIIFYFLVFISFAAIGWSEFNKYFLDWAKRPEVRGEFTQRYVDIAQYLNNLPPDINKYIIVNEGGVPVPFPNGIPMSAQTVIFLTHNTLKVSYLLPESGSFAPINKPGSNVFIPLRKDEQIFQELKTIFPEATIQNFDNFSVFKTND